jgi:hypothetical protein
LGIAPQKAQDLEEFRLSDGDSHRRLGLQSNPKTQGLSPSFEFGKRIVKLIRRLSLVINFRGSDLYQGTALAVPKGLHLGWALAPEPQIPPLRFAPVGMTETGAHYRHD